MTYSSTRPIALWLFGICFLLLMMVGVGGYTRLTGSGLSITEWKPVTGAIPPLSEEDWQREMDKYKGSPEYQKINNGFGLKEFKRIYRVEYFHRLLGRTLGLCFLLPLLYFMARRRLTLKQGLKLLGIFCLGGLQGLAGWYMVKSGLVDNPHVSHIRLTIHLLIALLIYSLLLWSGLKYFFSSPACGGGRISLPERSEVTKSGGGVKRTDVKGHPLQKSGLGFASDSDFLPPPQAGEEKKLYRLSLGFMALLIFQFLLGGFVAGMKAGFIYNTFPLMNGSVLPADALALQPWYANFIENGVMAQFLHRMNALLLLIYSVFLWYKVHDKATAVLAVMVLVQVSLGVSALLMEVPVWLGVLHQVYAFLVFGKALYVVYRFSPLKG